MRFKQYLFATATFIASHMSLSESLSALNLNSTEKLAQGWYRSFSDTFNYCMAVHFRSTICPPIATEERFNAVVPTGPLSPITLLQAEEAYRVGISPKDWLLSLKLADQKLKGRIKDDREILVARAKWLLAEVLYDDRQFESAEQLFDQALPYFKGRAKFHQERAWNQYFMGKFNLAMGSIMSAESPLVYRLPFTDKYFLKSLIERDSCQYTKALATLAEGRKLLTDAQLNVSQIPWVKTCQDLKLGPVCDRLVVWAQGQLKKDLDQSKVDLDFIELELAEKGFRLNPKVEVKTVVWPYVGEKWADELGHYSVEVSQQCPQN